MRETDGRTDRQRDSHLSTANTAFMHSNVRAKLILCVAQNVCFQGTIKDNNLLEWVSEFVSMTRTYTVSQKTGPLFTAYNFRNIEQIFTKFGTNQSLFILNIVPEII